MKKIKKKNNKTKGLSLLIFLILITISFVIFSYIMKPNKEIKENYEEKIISETKSDNINNIEISLIILITVITFVSTLLRGGKT